MYGLEAGRTLASLSSAQWGLLTAAQASQRGVGRLQLGRLAAAGNLERLAHGIYRDAGSPPTEFDDVRAAWLSTDPARTAEQRRDDGASGVIVGAATAAYLHQSGNLQPAPFIFISQARRQSQRPDLRYRLRPLTPDDITIIQGLPTTTIERTIADLVRDREDLSLVADVLASAVRRTPIQFDRLAELLEPLSARNGHARRNGRAFLENLLERAGVEVDTEAMIAENARRAVGNG